MPSYPVLQPDGQLAVWSTIVDHFTAFDCTPAEAAEVIDRQWRTPTPMTIDYCAAVQRGEKPFDHWQDWNSRVGFAMLQHGENDETVQQAIALTPDMTIAKLYYELGKAETAADELRFQLEDAIKRTQTASPAFPGAQTLPDDAKR